MCLCKRTYPFTPPLKPSKCKNQVDEMTKMREIAKALSETITDPLETPTLPEQAQIRKLLPIPGTITFLLRRAKSTLFWVPRWHIYFFFLQCY